MPFITHALLYASYALLALTTGLALINIGGSTASEAMLGAVSLFTAFAVSHAGLSAAFASGALRGFEKRMRGELDKVRVSHREMLADMDALSDRLDRLSEEVAVSQTHALAGPPEPEMKLLDQIVDRLGRAMDQRFEEIRAATPVGVSPNQPSPQDRLIDLVREALDESRIELHLQPIVSLPQRRTMFYEGFSRLKDSTGRVLAPADFMPAAEKAGLMGLIDNILLFRCIQLVRKLAEKDRRVAIFCNIAPRILADEIFFPQLYDFLREHREMAGALIFEVPQRAFEERTSVEARAMAKLVDLGYRFSLDKVTHLDVDIVDMERAGVRFFKAPGKLLYEGLVKEGVRPRSNITREIAANDVAAVFIRYSIDIIAERVETEDLVVELVDLEIPFGQGHLFGPPRPIKDSLMEETAPPKGYFQRSR